LGADVVDLMDALGLPRAVLAGYHWGGRAACVAAALWPERCTGLVSVNSYLVHDISTAMAPIRPDLEAGFWCFFYFPTERGRAGLTANRREIARVIWTRSSPEWSWDEAVLDRAAAFDNPDWVGVVLHSYRHRLGAAPGDAAHQELEDRLAGLPPVTVPAVTLDGLADGNFPATDGSPSAHRFTGPGCTTRSPAPGTTSPRRRPARSSTRCWRRPASAPARARTTD
jgi:pimeloyl-ACP methyl ester carboxylesterase